VRVTRLDLDVARDYVDDRVYRIPSSAVLSLNGIANTMSAAAAVGDALAVASYWKFGFRTPGP
jgi:hypothetical protein